MRVDRSIIVVGAFLSILGAALVYNGYGFVQLERGWTEVIAGTTVFSTGLVLIALGFILRTLSAIAASADRAALLLAKGRFPADSVQPATAFAGTAVEPAYAPATEHAPAPEPEYRPADVEVVESLGLVPTQEEPAHPAPVFAPVANEPMAEPVEALQPEIPAPSEPRAAANPLSWMIRPARAKSEPTPETPAPEPAFAEPDYRERRLQRVNFRETVPQPPVVEPPVAPEPVVDAPVYDEPVFETPASADSAPHEHALHETSPPHEPTRQAEPEPAPAAVDWLDQAMAEADPFFQLGAAPAAAKTKGETFYPDALPPTAVEPEEPAAIAPVHDEPAEPAPAEPAADEAPPHEHVAEGEPHAEAAPEAERPPLEVIGQYEANGTHYIMYADGSINAETAHGAYHFASMDELKRFIENQQ